MKFKINSNFLVKTSQELEIDAEQFLHCESIEELNNEIEDYMYTMLQVPNELGEAECLGIDYWDMDFEFFNKWQELKGLPKKL